MEYDSLFPDTPWNEFITRINKKVIELDSDKEAQKKYIEHVYFKLTLADIPKLHKYKKLYQSWYVSQLHIIGDHDTAEKYEHLHNSMSFWSTYGTEFIPKERLMELNKKYYGEDYYDEADFGDFDKALNAVPSQHEDFLNLI